MRMTRSLSMKWWISSDPSITSKGERISCPWAWSCTSSNVARAVLVELRCLTAENTLKHWMATRIPIPRLLAGDPVIGRGRSQEMKSTLIPVCLISNGYLR